MSVLLANLARRKKKIFMKPEDLKSCSDAAYALAYGAIKKKYKKNKMLYNGSSGVTTQEFIAAFVVIFHSGKYYRANGSAYDTFLDSDFKIIDCSAGKNRSIIDMFILMNTHYGYEFELFLEGIVVLGKNMVENVYPRSIINDFRALRCGDVQRFVFSYGRHGAPFRISNLSGKEFSGWNNQSTDSGISNYPVSQLLFNNGDIIDAYYRSRDKFEIQLYDKKV